MAREKVHSGGYVYKKGSSRSKKHGIGQLVDMAIKPKCSKVCSKERQSQMKEGKNYKT